jgi:hypothetical protein
VILNTGTLAIGNQSNTNHRNTGYLGIGTLVSLVTKVTLTIGTLLTLVTKLTLNNRNIGKLGIQVNTNRNTGNLGNQVNTNRNTGNLGKYGKTNHRVTGKLGNQHSYSNHEKAGNLNMYAIKLIVTLVTKMTMVTKITIATIETLLTLVTKLTKVTMVTKVTTVMLATKVAINVRRSSCQVFLIFAQI